MMLKIAFWSSLALILYVYVGYPVLIYLWSRFKPHPAPPVKGWAELPSVTVIIPAYNEERWIRRKIENTLALDYPRERLEVLVASDGSTDETVPIAREFAAAGVQVFSSPRRIGKQEILNCLIPQVKSEIVLLTDANALLDAQALRHLVRPFVDPDVACVTGRRVCILQVQSTASAGEGLYWRYDTWIKTSESKVHSCLGAHGQLCAVRRAVFPYVEKVGEDFFIPMKIIAKTNKRVICQPEAVAHIPAAARLGTELERKTRAHVSFLLTLPLLPELLLPWRSRVWLGYMSHHVLRLFVPPALIVLFVVSSLLARQGGTYLLLAVAQLVFHSLALVGFLLALFGIRPKIFYVPFYFVFANLAVFLAWLRWPVRKYDYAWERTERWAVPD